MWFANDSGKVETGMQTGEILASNTQVIMIANVFTMNLLIA